MAKIKLTTTAACRVVGLHRDRFNEWVAAGSFPCAPKTVPGRARLFDPDDMLMLMLFKRLMDDGFNADRAGNIACLVGFAAAQELDEDEIVLVESFVGTGNAFGASKMVSNANEASGLTIYKKTIFNVAHLRRLLEHYTEEERSIIGPDD